jgi:hypothetical protein
MKIFREGGYEFCIYPVTDKEKQNIAYYRHNDS